MSNTAAAAATTTTIATMNNTSADAVDMSKDKKKKMAVINKKEATLVINKAAPKKSVKPPSPAKVVATAASANGKKKVAVASATAAKNKKTPVKVQELIEEEDSEDDDEEEEDYEEGSDDGEEEEESGDDCEDDEAEEVDDADAEAEEEEAEEEEEEEDDDDDDEDADDEGDMEVETPKPKKVASSKTPKKTMTKKSTAAAATNPDDTKKKNKKSGNVIVLEEIGTTQAPQKPKRIRKAPTPPKLKDAVKYLAFFDITCEAKKLKKIKKANKKRYDEIISLIDKCSYNYSERTPVGRLFRFSDGVFSKYMDFLPVIVLDGVEKPKEFDMNTMLAQLDDEQKQQIYATLGTKKGESIEREQYLFALIENKFVPSHPAEMKIHCKECLIHDVVNKETHCVLSDQARKQVGNVSVMRQKTIKESNVDAAMERLTGFRARIIKLLNKGDTKAKSKSKKSKSRRDSTIAASPAVVEEPKVAATKKTKAKTPPPAPKKKVPVTTAAAAATPKKNAKPAAVAKPAETVNTKKRKEPPAPTVPKNQAPMRVFHGISNNPAKVLPPIASSSSEEDAEDEEIDVIAPMKKAKLAQEPKKTVTPWANMVHTDADPISKPRVTPKKPPPPTATKIAATSAYLSQLSGLPSKNVVSQKTPQATGPMPEIKANDLKNQLGAKLQLMRQQDQEMEKELAQFKKGNIGFSLIVK